MCQEYSNWETDEVITKELFRNLGIALACVFLTTLFLLANLLGSLIVLLCVAITLVFLASQSDAHRIAPLRDPNPIPSNPIPSTYSSRAEKGN